jgi:hypothetical protein
MLNLERLLDKYLGGHISFKNITIYGHNAMNWGITIKTKKYGYICFRLPIPTFYNNRPVWKPLYIYFSPNGTPWACTFAFGKDKNIDYDFAKSKLRYVYLGRIKNIIENSRDLTEEEAEQYEKSVSKIFKKTGRNFFNK